MSKKIIRLRNNPYLVIGLIAPTFFILGFGGYMLINSSRSQTIQKNSCEATTCVELKADRANPDTIAIKAGEYAQFNSADGKSHSLSLGLGGEEHEHTGQYNSGEFKADEAWRVQFKEPGTYKFHDHFNPTINILVVVYKDGEIPAI